MIHSRYLNHPHPKSSLEGRSSLLQNAISQYFRHYLAVSIQSVLVDTILKPFGHVYAEPGLSEIVQRQNASFLQGFVQLLKVHLQHNQVKLPVECEAAGMMARL